MSEVAFRAPGAIAAFSPQEFRTTQAKLDALIAYATEVKDWPLLDEAIDAKLDQQGRFVAWWGQTVTIMHGAGRGKKSADRGAFSMTDAERDTGIRHQQVSRWNKSLEDPERYREKLRLAAYRKAGLEPEPNRVTPNSGEQLWFTPTQYIEAAREVMGGIDLDPASHPLAQEVVQAAQWFGPEDDGLSLSWHGRVWLNPPYTFPLVGQFVDKLVTEYREGEVTDAIMLTNNCTDTAWFHNGEADASLLCFTRGRINFYGPDGIGEAPLQGQTFFYYGDDVVKFRKVFSQFGFVR